MQHSWRQTKRDLWQGSAQGSWGSQQGSAQGTGVRDGHCVARRSADLCQGRGFALLAAASLQHRGCYCSPRTRCRQMGTRLPPTFTRTMSWSPPSRGRCTLWARTARPSLARKAGVRRVVGSRGGTHPRASQRGNDGCLGAAPHPPWGGRVPMGWCCAPRGQLWGSQPFVVRERRAGDRAGDPWALQHPYLPRPRFPGVPPCPPAARQCSPWDWLEPAATTLNRAVPTRWLATFFCGWKRMMWSLGVKRQPRTTVPLRLTETHMVVVCTWRR